MTTYKLSKPTGTDLMQDGHAVSQGLGLVQVVCGEQNGSPAAVVADHLRKYITWHHELAFSVSEINVHLWYMFFFSLGCHVNEMSYVLRERLR